MMKDNLTRLVPAVARELREAAERRQRRQAESALRESQSLLSLIYDHTAEMLALYSLGPSAPGQRAGSGATRPVNNTLSGTVRVGRIASVNKVLVDFARLSPGAGA